MANLENRRATLTREALERLEAPPPVEVSWAAALNRPESLYPLLDCDRIRIDSFGESAKVHDRLIALGGGPDDVRLPRGKLAFLKEAHRGWLAVLERLARLGARPDAWLTPPWEIAIMFDKWRSHLRLHRAGVARPPAWLLPSAFDELEASLPGEGRWFLKPLYGSSGSGVCAFRWRPHRMQLIAPLELVRTEGDEVELFNSLKVRSYTRRDDIRAILDVLLPAGMIGEAWLPKARIGGKELDLRVVVVAGEARHVVVRTSHHPITNLHLGNQRGDLAKVSREHGADALEACRRLAEDALSAFPTALFAGVDVLLGRDRQPQVLEINAFGDLLPGVLDRGEDTATAILRAARRDSL